MNIKLSLKILSALIAFIGVCLIIPMALSILHHHDGEGLRLFIISSSSIIVGLFLFKILKPESKELTHKDGFFIVACGWTIFSFIGALPFYFSKYFQSFADAFFESASGFTTTGSTILTNIEAVAPSLLFWRSIIQWLGGMGIIVLSIAILPFLEIGGMQLYQAEVPGPTKDKLTPRIEDTAKLLWIVYFLFTLAEVILLMLGGMSLYDAVCHAFTTMATGGFSTKNASIAAYNSPYIDYVITFFMFSAGINFSLHYQLIFQKNFKCFLKNTEVKFYFLINLIATIILTISLYINKNYHTIIDSFRYAVFQAVSIVTTTGYGTADYEKWSYLCQFLLILLMLIGGCAGSTGGGIKHIRIYVYLKYTWNQIFKIIHPNAVKNLKIEGKIVEERVISSILSFIALYFLIFTISSILLLAFGGQDIVTSLSAIIATLSNIGPGLGNVGPVDNFSGFTAFGKIILSFCMIIGRLEFYTILVIFAPDFWKNIKFS